MTTAPEVRFSALYEETEDGCWLWIGFVKPNGYAQFRPGGSAFPVYAHRWSYEHFVCSIPDGMEIDHLCRVRHCVNPEHLDSVTRRENLLRGDTLPAKYASRTTCNHGHNLTPENTTKNGRYLRCRECARASHKRWLESRERK